MAQPNVAEVVVEREPDFRGWRIREKGQLPGTGMIVTDHWLATFGFSAPSKFNIDKIIEACVASLHGYAPVQPDLDRSAKLYGDPFAEKGSAPDIEYGEGLRGIK